MATDIVTDQFIEPAPDGPGGLPVHPPRYTPEDHAKVAGNLKVVRLIDLGEGAHGKTATFEFTGGFVRSLDVDAQNVWHSVLRPIIGADWRRLLEHVAPSSRCDDGTLLVQSGPMWFWTERTTARGRFLSSNHFDVPNEDYAHGCLTGARAARDLILFLSRYERAREMGPLMGLEREIQASLRDAFGHEHAHRGGESPSARGAASIFTETMVRYFVVGAMNANPAYLDGKVERARETVKWSEEHDERVREKLADRLRAARAAKVAKRSGSSNLGASNARVKFSEDAASSGHTLQ